MTDAAKKPGANDAGTADACGGCVIGRREFLRVGAAIAGGIAATAAIAGPAAAMPVRFGSALSRSGKDVRYPVPTADGATIDKDNDVIIARVGTTVYALDLTCPHQNTAIRWSARDKQFECPKHHSKYTPAGIFIEGRATRSLDRFPIRRDGAQLLVNVDASWQEDHDHPQWAAALITL